MDGTIRACMGICYIKIKNIRKAKIAFTRAYELNPENE